MDANGMACINIGAIFITLCRKIMRIHNESAHVCCYDTFSFQSALLEKGKLIINYGKEGTELNGGEVIKINSAHYGRMEVGRCVNVAYGNIKHMPFILYLAFHSFPLFHNVLLFSISHFVTGTNITLTLLMLTQFILVQPVTHKGNSLKKWFTKYTTHGANQTKLRTSIVPWSQIHGTGQSKPRTYIVIYVNFLNYQRNAYSSSRHTTQAYTDNRQPFNTCLHILHTAYYHTES